MDELQEEKIHEHGVERIIAMMNIEEIGTETEMIAGIDIADKIEIAVGTTNPEKAKLPEI